MRRVAAAALLALACHHDDTAAREAALHHDLLEMRKAIDDFREDKRRGPHSLSELKTSHYLRNIPADPITRVHNWRVVTEQAVRTDDFAQGTANPSETEIVDVRSRAVGRDSKGKPYSEY